MHRPVTERSAFRDDKRLMGFEPTTFYMAITGSTESRAPRMWQLAGGFRNDAADGRDHRGEWLVPGGVFVSPQGSF